MRFKKLYGVDVCNPEAVLAIASFFVKTVPFVPHLNWGFYYQGKYIIQLLLTLDLLYLIKMQDIVIFHKKAV
ncbi:hypothetical protein ABKP09_11280 [Peribacillus frigoritolerans]|uniref:hypothetical protein n=1 Tax=Peribacillus frigoritolerans TaxID=450367 RepID=UPI0032B592CC